MLIIKIDVTFPCWAEYEELAELESPPNDPKLLISKKYIKQVNTLPRDQSCTCLFSTFQTTQALAGSRNPRIMGFKCFELNVSSCPILLTLMQNMLTRSSDLGSQYSLTIRSPVLFTCILTFIAESSQNGVVGWENDISNGIPGRVLSFSSSPFRPESPLF